MADKKSPQRVDLSNLVSPRGSRKRPIRVGRGTASGRGCTAGRGTKGQKARSGAKIRPWFEGGQMPLQRRTPKRGFVNIHRVEVQVVNVGDLSVFDESAEITKKMLKEKGLIHKADLPVKLLGKGVLRKPVKIRVDQVSDGAREKLESAGGTVELLSG